MALSSPSPSPPPAASTGFNLLGGFLMDDFLRETFHLVVESFHKDLLSGSGGKNMSAGLALSLSGCVGRERDIE